MRRELVGGLINLVFGALFLFVAYGVAAIILRYAFGLVLPNPLDLLPPEWR